VDRGRGGTEFGLDDDPNSDDPGLGELLVLLGVDDGLVDPENEDDEPVDGEADASSWSTLAKNCFASGVGNRAMDLPPNLRALV